MTLPPSATATTAIKTAAVADGSASKPPPIVSPTPTPEQLGDLASAMVMASSSPKAKPPALKKPKTPYTLPKFNWYARKGSFPTVGHHDEMYEDENWVYSESRHTQTPASLLPSSATASMSSTHPPLVNRYCGGCGDLLSRKVYGCDEHGCDRRLQYHPRDQRMENDRQRIQAAAKSIQERFASTVKPLKKSSKSTKASRKRKKMMTRHERDLLNPEWVKGLSVWPDETLRMDMTMVEGLLSLKHASREESNCKCWHAPAKANSKLANLPLGAGYKTPSPTAKKKTKLAKQLAAGGSGVKPKLAVAAKKKSTLLKGAGSEVVSTRFVIVKCPKTGKKIKKKIVKKKRVLPKLPISQKSSAPSAATISAIMGSPVGGGSPSSKPKTLSALALQQTGGGDKENHRGNPDHPASKTGVALTGKLREADNDELLAHHEGNSSDEGSVGAFSGKKRRRNDEKADPDLRDRLMNCPLENGPLFPSQQELMELTTIRKRNALQTFYKRFNELRQFIAIFGDANVPQQFPENHSLGIWVNKMRMERKKWDTGSERTSLTERKIELLESIDFIWAQNHKGEIGWERRFQEIRKFKRKHGHCNVPTKSAENRALGRWVSTQRTMYKNYMKGFVGKSLTREEQERRIFLLLKEGFLFSMIPNGQNPNGTEGGTNPADGSTELPLPGEGGVIADGTITDGMIIDGKDTSATDATTPAIISATMDSSSPGTESKVPEMPVAIKESTKDDPVLDSVPKNGASEESKEEPTTTKEETKDVPASPSQTIPPKTETTTALTPPASRTSSIAHVSITTTPTTTPSVSTTASPDRSPEKEPPSTHESIKAKVEVDTEKTGTVEDKRKDVSTDSVSGMPVAPVLKKEPEPVAAVGEKAEDHATDSVVLEKQPIPQAKPTADTKPPLSPPTTPTPESQQREEKSGTKNSRSSPKIKSVALPATAPKQENETKKAGKADTIKDSNPDEPQLVTSDGLRIIIKMKDFEEPTERRLSPKKTSESSPSKPLSPSRRSVRARKPSARQLEAEKTPPILGR